ncbi:hypothetical protein OIU74_008422 [Salix koriyanagi]|uniref:Uncharacterized protein n=1 Tax=Salix koriyanagi TaxID=2511006 RepID=A0A9Q0TQ21_9ROSI|nr:hypothetical protein OIU74_008422 [Salix koriyanagi]
MSSNPLRFPFKCLQIQVDRDTFYLLIVDPTSSGSDFLRLLPCQNISDINVLCLSWLEVRSEDFEGPCCQLT